MHTPEEWVQVSCTYDDLQRALQELDITYHFHVHQTAQDGGCSEEIVSALQQETGTKEAAEELSQDMWVPEAPFRVPSQRRASFFDYLCDAEAGHGHLVAYPPVS